MTIISSNQVDIYTFIIDCERRAYIYGYCIIKTGRCLYIKHRFWEVHIYIWLLYHQNRSVGARWQQHSGTNIITHRQKIHLPQTHNHRGRSYIMIHPSHEAHVLTSPLISARWQQHSGTIIIGYRQNIHLLHANLSRARSHLPVTAHPSAYQHASFRPSHTHMHVNSHSTCTQCTMP